MHARCPRLIPQERSIDYHLSICALRIRSSRTALTSSRTARRTTVSRRTPPMYSRNVNYAGRRSLIHRQSSSSDLRGTRMMLFTDHSFPGLAELVGSCEVRRLFRLIGDFSSPPPSDLHRRCRMRGFENLPLRLRCRTWQSPKSHW
jgi:hypothetical protein